MLKAPNNEVQKARVDDGPHSALLIVLSISAEILPVPQTNIFVTSKTS